MFVGAFLIASAMGVVEVSNPANSYVVTVTGLAQYNPIDIFGKRWYISQVDTKIRPQGLLEFNTIPLIMGFGETGRISVSGYLTAPHQATSYDCGTYRDGTFDQITGGTTSFSISCKGVPPGSYTLKLYLYEGNELRQSKSIGVDVQ